ncbi:hypothetical protein L1987_48593 [Smallanthus sonchifolius]|uniref:Uncharacterized protein n=1 Tax=Smallanthus sonchifolius TaxID=185202 RepID=A0ACB9FTA2_9ASTR|nr:hypothetical protein L1987_48593 [Smallanthus sonchifolius]
MVEKDPILSTSNPVDENGSEDERAENTSQSLGEFMLREEVVSDRMNDRIAYDDYRVEISSTILDPITIVNVYDEVSEASSSQSVDSSSADSHVEELVSPISSRASDLPDVNTTNLQPVIEEDDVPRLDLLAPNFGDYHDLIKYLKHSKVYFALTINPVIYEAYIRQFWESTALSAVNGVEMIKATVNGQEFSISEGSIRTHLRSSSSESSSDDYNNEDGDNAANDDVVFETEDLHTTQDTQPVSFDHERVLTLVQRSPAHAHDEVMPSWAFTLQSQNESLQKAVADLTSLVSSLNCVVSSNSSSEGDAVRQGEMASKEEIFDVNEVADVANVLSTSPFSDNADKVVDDDAGPSSPISENIVSPLGSPITNVDKGKKIAIEAEPEVTSKTKLSKEMEEELSRKAIADLLRLDELEAKADAEIAKARADSLSSILS